MGKFIDLTGQLRGRWFVLSFSHRANNECYWLCRCSCKERTERPVRAKDLRHGMSQSCGCTITENNRAKRKMTTSRETLEWLYYDQKKTASEVSQILGFNKATVLRRMSAFGMRRRTNSEANRLAHKNNPGRKAMCTEILTKWQRENQGVLGWPQLSEARMRRKDGGTLKKAILAWQKISAERYQYALSCRECGKAFSVPLSRKERKYCSRKCYLLSVGRASFLKKATKGIYKPHDETQFAAVLADQLAQSPHLTGKAETHETQSV